MVRLFSLLIYSLLKSLCTENNMSDEQTVQKLEEMDRLTLALANANVRAAAAQNEAAEMSRRNIVLQLYMKYSLTNDDAIDENGNILKGGAVQKTQ